MKYIWTIFAVLGFLLVGFGAVGLIARFILQPLFYLLSIPTYAAIFMLEHFVAGISPDSWARNLCRLSIPKSFEKKLVVNGMASWMTLMGVVFFMAFSNNPSTGDAAGIWKAAFVMANANWGPFLIVTFWGSFVGLLYLNRKYTDDSSTPINKLQDLVIPDWAKRFFGEV